MNPLAFSWIAFIAAWKFLPSEQDDLNAGDVILSLAFFLSLILILHPSKSRDFRAVAFVLPFFAAAFIARANLGKTWGVPSERIETGLYAFLSHPLYLAIFLAGIVSAFLSRAPHSIIGVGLLGATLTTAAYIDDTTLKEKGK